MHTRSRGRMAESSAASSGGEITPHPSETRPSRFSVSDNKAGKRRTQLKATESAARRDPSLRTRRVSEIECMRIEPRQLLAPGEGASNCRGSIRMHSISETLRVRKLGSLRAADSVAFNCVLRLPALLSETEKREGRVSDGCGVISPPEEAALDSAILPLDLVCMTVSTLYIR